MECAGLSKILLILGRLRRFLPGPKLDSVENALIGIPGANSTINFHLRCPVTADLPDAVATYNHPHPVKPLSVATNTPSGGA
jgi:hypothetical protein